MNDLSAKIFEEFPKRKIVIIGDLVADQFLRGTISRVSREAPVFILRHDETETIPGGAANAAVNVASLGGNAVIVGVIGDDLAGKTLLEKLREQKVNTDSVIAFGDYKTTAKLRVLAGQRHTQPQQVVRIDYENSNSIDASIEEKLLENFQKIFADADAVIISDYNYGAAGRNIAEKVITLCREKDIPVTVDSRFRLENFKNATSATPNREEAEDFLGEAFDAKDCEEMRRELGFESLLITLGNKGMLLIEKDKKPVQIEAVGAKKPVDVTGAGDTVIAAYTLGLASGFSFEESANIANHAGGIVVMKSGTAFVSPEELTESLRKNLSSIGKKHA